MEAKSFVAYVYYYTLMLSNCTQLFFLQAVYDGIKCKCMVNKHAGSFENVMFIDIADMLYVSLYSFSIKTDLFSWL